MEKIMTEIELKLVLIEILNCFVSFCEENNLNYMLEGGTLLGAIRHKGFIPWDDDIDIAMPREDYERMHQIIRKKPLPSRYRLESLQYGNSPYPFAKIVDTKTVIVNSGSTLHKSLWIDVFPLDGIPDYSLKDEKCVRKKLKRYSFLLENACCKIGSGKNAYRKLLKIFVILFSRIRGPFYYGKKMDELAKCSTDQYKYAGNVVWSILGPHKVLKTEELFDYIEVEFEGKLYKTTKFYDKYLSGYYGNYMELPPEDKRINHSLKAEYVKD